MKSAHRTAFVILAIITGLLSEASGAGADHFANRTLITGSYFTDLITPMNNFTREANEPVQGPDPSASGLDRTAWWRWVAPSDGLCTIELPDTGKFIFKNLSVYTGSTLSSLTRVADGNTPSALSCSTTFYAAAGTEYNIAAEAIGIIDPAEALLVLRHLPASYPGRYLGQWQSNFQELVPSGNGIVSLTVAPGGSVTGVLTAGATRYSFKSQLQTNGNIVASFARKTAPGTPLQPPLTVSLNLPLTISNLANAISIRVADGAYIQGHGELDRVLSFTAASPAPVAGNFIAGADFPTAIAGSGFLSAKISPTGKVTIAGATGDGQKFTMGAALVANSEVPLHYSFGAQRGFLNGRIRATDGMPDRITGGGIDYFRPAANSTFYPLGLATTVDVNGAAIRKPAAGQRALGFLDASNGAGKLTISAAAGEINGVVENLTLSSINQFIFTNAGRAPKLKLNPATGLVSGSIIEPAGTPRKLVGALYESNGTPRLRGWVSGIKRTTLFTVTP